MHAFLFKCSTRKYGRTNSDLHRAFALEKNCKGKEALLNHKIAPNQSLQYELFTESRESTFRLWKTTEKSHFISQHKIRQSWTKKSSDEFSLLALLPTRQTRKQLHLFNLAFVTLHKCPKDFCPRLQVKSITNYALKNVIHLK